VRPATRPPRSGVGLRPALLGALLVGLAGLAGPAALRAAEPAPLPTVAEVDLARYAGTWYEIALIPNRFQKQCVADTRATYRPQDGGIEVINRCRTADGQTDEAKGRAKIVPDSGNAKLRVSFFWPFYGDYWVLALDPDYRNVLVGEPRRQYGWVLSREREMTAARFEDLMARAQALGYAREAFVKTPQTGPVP